MTIRTKLGIAKIDITPYEPLPLAGFAHRKSKYEGISQRLFLRVWLFEQQNEDEGDSKPQLTAARRVLLVQADIIWWSSERMDGLLRRLRDRFSIDETAILLNASHTHGGPETSATKLPLLGIHHPEYTEMLEHRLFEGVELAFADLEPVRIQRGQGECGIGIHRRNWLDGKIAMLPNHATPIDRDVTVLRFTGDTGSVKGVLFHYTCHPTTTNDNLLTSEYPGVAMEQIERSLGGGVVATFLQGCCGDVRPELIADGKFYSGHDEDVRRLGKELADAVLCVLEAPLKELRFVAFRAFRTQAELPYQQLPTIEELERCKDDEGVKGEWSRMLLAYPERLQRNVPLTLSLVEIADELAFLTMDGEVVIDYGLFIKQQSQGRILPLAYTNGMVGYIPTASQVKEGGYEGKDSVPYFALPAPFDEALEERILHSIRHLMEQVEIIAT